MGRLALAALLALPVAAASASAASAAAGRGNPAGGSTIQTVAARETALHIPKPTGKLPIGMTSLYLKDASRPDPWVSSVKARELMVSLWYPAAKAGGARAAYMTVKESELTLKEAGVSGVPGDLLSKTRIDAVKDAKPAAKGRLPLVILSPGFTKPRYSLTGLAEDLASRGYAVAVVGHTYENVVTSFPDGRVAECAACEMPHDAAFWAKVDQVRAVDVTFVLDSLLARYPKLIDRSKIAMGGHSVGGAASVSALLKDARLRAGMNIDGTMDVSVPSGRLAKPFLLLGTEVRHSPGKDASWDKTWTNLTGWKRWFVVSGTEHASFTDISVLSEQLGIDDGADLPATRSLKITRAIVAAFYDQHLRGKAQPLLNDPGSRFQEVKSVGGTS
ncbi:alpha/beta hydrolase family protein [Nonomuraea sp. NPDC050153]|uniref:alpha/beta hydrolase family protein n=1 Tax=Nonomuraea sp. NPDC050153 TaxID=3364359 RepID=UPI00379E66F4